MTTTVGAIYEKAVLRLAEPIALPEGTPVEVIVIACEPAPADRTPAEILAAIAAMPIEPGGEEFSGRDRDRILYGGQHAR